MNFPRLKASGKKVYWKEFDKKAMRGDLQSFRTARDAYCWYAKGCEWINIEKEKKPQYIKEIIKTLENLPHLENNGDWAAIKIGDALRQSGGSPQEALKFAHLMLSKKHVMPSRVELIEMETRGGRDKQKSADRNAQRTEGSDGDNTANANGSGEDDGAFRTNTGTGEPHGEQDVTGEGGGYDTTNTENAGTGGSRTDQWRPQREMNDRDAFMVIYGLVRDAGTKKPVKAVIHISGPESHRGVTNKSGVYYQGVSTEGFEYVVECMAAGYKSEKKKDVEVMKAGRGRVRTRVDFELTKKSGKQGVTRRMASYTGGRMETHFKKFFVAFLIILAGVFASLIAGCALMMAAFATWALLCFIPEPLPIEALKKSGIGVMINLNMDKVGEDGQKTGRMGATREAIKEYFGKNPANSGLGALRSILKVVVITLFVASVKFCTVPFQTPLLIAIAFIGYFWMSPSVERDNPATVIEATIRFGALGCFIIPFWIFWSAFGSLTLAFIAFAFFAVPPVYKEETEGEKDLMGFFSKIWFSILMLLALLGCGVIPGISFGPSWELHGGLAVFFIYFWVVCAVAGFFSSHQARPVIGIFMLLIATVVYGMTAGTQDVGMALFGPYFPQAFKAINDIISPVSEAFTQVGGTFGTAWQLLVNPVGFANGMMNSTYASDPLSEVTGPLGVEIDDVRVTPIYPYSPFSIIVKLRNRGASPAGNIEVNISAYETWSPKEQKTVGTKDRMVLGDLGFTDEDNQVCKDLYGDKAASQDTITTCTQTVNDGKLLQRLDIRQAIFMTHVDSEAGSEQGLTCETINKYALRESKFRKKWGIQFIPITASVAYDYNMSSSLDMSFISADEWTRMTEDEEAFVPQRKEAATNTNSPAHLNMDTLEQPIREGTPFHLGIALSSAKTTGSVTDVYYITVTLPATLAAHLSYCMPETDGRLEGSGAEGVENTDGSLTLTWSSGVKKRTQSSVIFCSFDGLEMINKSSSSFLVQANASFRYRTSKIETTNVEWGGGVVCCTKDAHCPYTDVQTCDAASQKCVLKEPSVELPPQPKVGGTGYCAARKEDYPSDQAMWCKEGYGQCSAGECSSGLVCTSLTVGEEPMSLCCFSGKEDECKSAYATNVG